MDRRGRLIARGKKRKAYLHRSSIVMVTARGQGSSVDLFFTNCVYRMLYRMFSEPFVSFAGGVWLPIFDFCAGLSMG